MQLQTELFYSYTNNMIFITWKFLGSHFTNEMFQSSGMWHHVAWYMASCTNVAQDLACHIFYFDTLQTWVWILG